MAAMVVAQANILEEVMIKKIALWVFGLGFMGKWGEWLNGKKTLLGVISLLLYVLSIAHTVIPQCEGICPQVAEAISQGLFWIGVVLTPVGVTHKVLKK